jgi:hypothetical protein
MKRITLAAATASMTVFCFAMLAVERVDMTAS